LLPFPLLPVYCPCVARANSAHATRGSWNRDPATGYKIVFMPFNNQGQPEGYYGVRVTFLGEKLG